MAQTECSNCGYPWAVSGGKCPNCGADNCFITTAMCAELGLPDDCRELTALRAFRDRHMTTTSDRLGMLARYYQDSPAVVGKLQAHPHRSTIYAELREKFIGPAVQAAESENDLLAEQIYVEGMRWVVNRLA